MCVLICPIFFFFWINAHRVRCKECIHCTLPSSEALCLYALFPSSKTRCASSCLRTRWVRRGVQWLFSYSRRVERMRIANFMHPLNLTVVICLFIYICISIQCILKNSAVHRQSSKPTHWNKVSDCCSRLKGYNPYIGKWRSWASYGYFEMEKFPNRMLAAKFAATLNQTQQLNSQLVRKTR